MRYVLMFVFMLSFALLSGPLAAEDAKSQGAEKWDAFNKQLEAAAEDAKAKAAEKDERAPAKILPLPAPDAEADLGSSNTIDLGPVEEEFDKALRRGVPGYDDLHRIGICGSQGEKVMEAVQRRQVGKLMIMLLNGCRVDAEFGSSRTTLLHEAVQESVILKSKNSPESTIKEPSTDIVLLLLAAAGSKAFHIVNARKSRGHTPLHSAVEQQFYFLDWLPRPEADPDAPSPDEARENLRKIIIWLTTAGVSIDAQDDDGGTPLMLAVATRSVMAVRLLLEQGANAKSTNAYGETVLDIARRQGGGEITRIIEEHLKKTSCAEALQKT